LDPVDERCDPSLKLQLADGTQALIRARDAGLK